MPDVVKIERFRDVRDPRLGRHVVHDERSRRFAVLPGRAATPLHSVRHERHVPVFDQGATGSCTGMAAVGCMGTGPFFATIDPGDAPTLHLLDEAEAVAVYRAATRIDPFPGEYPSTDTGSDGLSVAKVLHQAGAISGYRHAFGLDQALAALMDVPLIVGTTWRAGMYVPDDEGIAHPTGNAEGGHEYVMDSYDYVRGLIGFTNSWGGMWGARGRFYMPAEEFADLLADNGDVTVFVPPNHPPPQPADPEAHPADEVLAAKLGVWASRECAICSRRARAAVREWLTARWL